MRSSVQATLVASAAAVSGAAIAWLDSRPGWDDAGITAGLLVAVSGICGFAWPQRPWVPALLAGASIPLVAFTHRQSPWSLLVLAFTFAGAYAGMAIRRALSKGKT